MIYNIRSKIITYKGDLSMIITSGQMIVKENKNKSAKFFAEVEVGDVIEVRFNINVHVTRRVSDRLVTVHNLTKNTSRTDAPIYLNAGLDKMVLESIPQDNESEYHRGYQEAVEMLKDAYINGHIEDCLFEDVKDKSEEPDSLW